MGKNWKGTRGGGSKGGGGGGQADLPSVRGFACVAGAREREANRELVNILSEALDELYPIEDTAAAVNDPTTTCIDALQAELEAVRNQSHTGTQRVRSINTGIKGFVLARISDRNACPVKLVAHIFKRVEETKMPCARNLVRVFPLQRTFYPNEEELGSAIADVSKSEWNHVKAPVDQTVSDPENVKRPAEDSIEDASGPKKMKLDAALQEVCDEVTETTLPMRAHPEAPIVHVAAKGKRYNLFFNRRNNDVLNKQIVLEKIWAGVPGHVRYNYKAFEGAFIVEVFKNVAGVSYVHDFASLHDLNIRKFQGSFGLTVTSEKEKKRKSAGDELVEQKINNDFSLQDVEMGSNKILL